MKTVLVTGSNGFIGRSLVIGLQRNFRVRAAVRTRDRLASVPVGADRVIVGDVGPETDWQDALEGVDLVVHLAARAHVLDRTGSSRADAFQWTNVAGTARLARQAASAGVERLVFLSSIGVNGARSGAGGFTETTPPRPRSPYAVSKWQAELELQRISREHGLDTVILRPPLVYGPSAPGNFTRLVRWVRRGFPVPVPLRRNERSLLYIGNLADAIERSLADGPRGYEVYLVADAERVSTRELVGLIARGIGCRPRYLAMPAAMLRLAGHLTGRASSVEGLVGSLRISTEKIASRLGWRPATSTHDAVAASARQT